MFKYRTVGTVPKSIPITHIYMTAHIVIFIWDQFAIF